MLLLNFGVREDAWESLGLQEIKLLNPKGNQTWIFIERTDAEVETHTLGTWCKKPTLWKIPWCWERLKAGWEEDDRGWDGWMASLAQWTWVWVGSGSWWWSGKPGVLQSMGSQTVRHDWTTELTDYTFLDNLCKRWMRIHRLMIINRRSKSSSNLRKLYSLQGNWHIQYNTGTNWNWTTQNVGN